MKIGIDLGTTFTSVSYMDAKGVPRIIPDSINTDLFQTPSVVHIKKDSCLVGYIVEELLKDDPTLHAIRFVKQAMGLKEKTVFDGLGRSWLPETISAMILKKVKQDAEMFLDEKISEVVITVPAHFSDVQRKATVNASRLAGLTLIDLLEEPIAAAYHYGIKHSPEDEMLIVFDLGGGTLDITLINSTKDGMYVIGVDGDSHLGGKDFDDIIQGNIIETFILQYDYDPTINISDMVIIRKIAEQIKIKLSQPGITIIKEIILLGNRSLQFVITRQQFENLIKDLIDKSLAVMERCLRASSFGWEMIDKIVMVGGSSLIPILKTRIQQLSQKSEIDILLHLPQKAIAFGAALHCNSLEGFKTGVPPIKQRVLNSSLGIRIFDFKKNKEDLDAIIPINTPLPVKIKKKYYTHRDDQEHLELIVVQDRPGSNQHVDLGAIKFGPFPIPRKGYALEVELECTINGIVNITAKDFETGKEVSESMIDEFTADASKLDQQLELLKMIKVNAK